MLRDFFGGNTSAVPQPQAPAIPAPVIDYGPAFFSLVEVCDRISKRLDEMRETQMKAPETKQEIVTFGPAMTYTFDDKGYKYFGLFATANGTITVNAMNIVYPLAIVAGFNKIVLPPNATLTMAAVTSMLAVWSDHLEI